MTSVRDGRPVPAPRPYPGPGPFPSRRPYPAPGPSPRPTPPRPPASMPDPRFRWVPPPDPPTRLVPLFVPGPRPAVPRPATPRPAAPRSAAPPPRAAPPTSPAPPRASPRRAPVAPRPPRAAGAHRRHAPPRTRLEWTLAGVVVAVAATARAIGLTRANDLFIDELTYSHLASMLAAGRLPAMFGVPFFLHPPGGMLLDGATIRLLDLRGTAMDLVFTLRWVHAVLGVVTVLLGYLVVRHLTTRTVAVAAALVLALDPFVLRNDTRVMLETPMTTFLVGGLLALLIAQAQPPGRVRAMLAVCAGLLLGCAVFSKDMAAAPIGLMLVLACVLRNTLPPATVLRVASAVPTPYAVYLVVVAQQGLLPAWWNAKTFGMRRMAGLEQITGFNMAGAPSLSARLLVQLGRFGTSYVLLAGCLLVGMLAARSPHPGRRLVGFLTTGAGLLGGYAAVAGTLEEQFGYVVAVSCVLGAACAARDLHERDRLRRPLRATAVVFLAATAVLGTLARTADDDGFRRARTFLDTGLLAGARVGFTGVTAEFALLPHPGFGVWPSLRSLAANHAGYVMTQSQPLTQGYGYASPDLLKWLAAHGRPVFSFFGPTNGATIVWQLDRNAVEDAVAHGDLLPPVSGGYP